MKWFSKREAKPDPIGDICRLLVEKAWEWTPGRMPSAKLFARASPTLTHLSGVFVAWDHEGYGVELRVLFGFTPGAADEVRGSDRNRLREAIKGNAAARITRPRVSFDDATRAMAQAVLDGDAEAARQLADFVMEHCGGTKGAA